MSLEKPEGAVGGLVPSADGVPSPKPREMPVAQVEGEALNWQGTVLDIRDPVEAALSDILHIYRIRRPHMMMDGDVFATFATSARSLDLPQFGVPEALLHLMHREEANISAMRRSGTLFNPNNQEALAAYLETAFYANLLFAWVKRYTRG